MFARSFNSFNTRTGRGCRSAANTCACANSANYIRLICLDTALAVSIFAALRLVAIRLVRLICAGVIVPGDNPERPPWLTVC